jgi:hypothetical protein
VLDRAELETRYGCEPDANISHPPRLPDTFVVAGLSSRTLTRDPGNPEALFVWAPASRAEHVALHLRHGRVLRIFHAVDADGRNVRYLGEYVIDQKEPVVAAPRSTRVLDWLCIRIRAVTGTTDLELPMFEIGATYRPEHEEISFQVNTAIDGASRLQQMIRDPESTRVHRRLQNNLADQVRKRRLQPLSPNQLDSKFDLAFHQDGKLVIIEVKSLSRDQERNQLMKGFGQVCLYAYQYRQQGQAVTPVLYVEHQPSTPDWALMCAEHGVVLAWPETVDCIFVTDATPGCLPQLADAAAFATTQAQSAFRQVIWPHRRRGIWPQRAVVV